MRASFIRPMPALGLFVIGLVVVSLVLAGCGVGSPAAQSVAARSGEPAVSPSVTVAPSVRPDTIDGDHQAWLLVGRPGEPDLQLVQATNGEIAFAFPAGAPRENWDRIVSATRDGASTIVRDTILQPGLGGPELRIRGAWQLPSVGLDPIPAGRSLDGSTIALVEGSRDMSSGQSRFAIVEHALLDTVQTAGDAPLRLARIVELAGAFAYDALSPDGRILYVVEHLDATAGGRYQVRAVDVATGVMRDGVIVDKGNPDETMAGSPIAQVRRPGGLVLTLYNGPEHPFIHALMTSEAWAICIDLPVPAHGSHDDTAAFDWGLTPSADGRSVFAVNASVGLAVEVDVAGLAVRRSASIDTTAARSNPIVLAKFGHDQVGPIGRRVVAAPDGSLVFAAGQDGVAAIRTKDLAVARRVLTGSAVDTLGITPDGRTLFALLHGSGQVVAVDVATGKRLGAVPGGGFDRLLAVAPW